MDFGRCFSKDSIVYCFGEILYDVYPNQRIPGGAPMNVALHLAQLGIHSRLISRVGEDSEGEGLLDFIEQYKVPRALVQKDQYFHTGMVQVDVTDDQNVNYTIQAPSAWDFIRYDVEVASALGPNDLLVFGSLGVRNETSYRSLLQYLEADALKVMDINLRFPHYTLPRLEILMRKADVLKINEDELNYFSGVYELKGIVELTDFLMVKFDLSGILVTQGEKGVYANFGSTKIMVSGPKVEKIKDTIGSGDAFLAGFLAQFLKSSSLNDCLHFGCVMGAFVATKRGANPTYSLEDIARFQTQETN